MAFVASETMKCFGCGAEGHLSPKPDRRLVVWAWIGRQRRPVVGVVVKTEEEHPGETCSPVASQDAEKTGQNGLKMQEKTMEGQSVIGTIDNSVMKKQMKEEKGKKVCSDGDSVLNYVLMEDICDDTGLTVKTNKWKKRGGKNTQSEVKRWRMLQTISYEEEEKELTASQAAQIASYSVEYIKQFLAQTKGWRYVWWQYFFPDLTGFIRFMARFRRQDTFDILEVYRLKKLLTKAKSICNGTCVGGVVVDDDENNYDDV